MHLISQEEKSIIKGSLFIIRVQNLRQSTREKKMSWNILSVLLLMTMPSFVPMTYTAAATTTAAPGFAIDHKHNVFLLDGKPFRLCGGH